MGGRLRRLEVLVIICIVCFGFFAWRTYTEERVLEEAATKQSQTINKLLDGVRDQGENVKKMSKSVQDATDTLAARLTSVSSEFQTRQSQMDTIQSRLHTVEVTMRNTQKAQSVPPRPTNSTAIPPVADITPTVIASASAAETNSSGGALVLPALPSRTHAHPIGTSIPIPRGALAHQTSAHQIDYWIVPRVLESGDQMLKVQPYGTNPLGVMVHCLDDGVDYILTPEGGWTLSLEQQ